MLDEKLIKFLDEPHMGVNADGTIWEDYLSFWGRSEEDMREITRRLFRTRQRDYAVIAYTLAMRAIYDSEEVRT